MGHGRPEFALCVIDGNSNLKLKNGRYVNKTVRSEISALICSTFIHAVSLNSSIDILEREHNLRLYIWKCCHIKLSRNKESIIMMMKCKDSTCQILRCGLVLAKTNPSYHSHPFTIGKTKIHFLLGNLVISTVMWFKKNAKCL